MGLALHKPLVYRDDRFVAEKYTAMMSVAAEYGMHTCSEQHEVDDREFWYI